MWFSFMDVSRWVSSTVVALLPSTGVAHSSDPGDLSSIAAWFESPNAELVYDWRFERFPVSEAAVEAARDHVGRILDSAGLEVSRDERFVPLLDDEVRAGLMHETLRMTWPYWDLTTQWRDEERRWYSFVEVRDRVGTARTHFVDGELVYQGRDTPLAAKDYATGAAFAIWRAGRLLDILSDAIGDQGWTEVSAGSSRFDASWAQVEAVAGEYEPWRIFPPGFGRYTGFVSLALSDAEGNGHTVRIDWTDPLGARLATDEIWLNAEGAPTLFRQSVWLPGGGPLIFEDVHQGLARRIGDVTPEEVAWEQVEDLGLDSPPSSALVMGAREAEVEGDYRVALSVEETRSSSSAPDGAPLQVQLSGGGVQRIELTPAQARRSKLELLVVPTFAPGATFDEVRPTCECGTIERSTPDSLGPWELVVERAASGSLYRFAAFDLDLILPTGASVRTRVELTPESGVMPGAILPVYVGRVGGSDPRWAVEVPLDADLESSCRIGQSFVVDGHLNGELVVTDGSAPGRRVLAGELRVADDRLWGAVEGTARIPLMGGAWLELLLLGEWAAFEGAAPFRLPRPDSGREAVQAVSYECPPHGGGESVDLELVADGALDGFVTCTSESDAIELVLDWSSRSTASCGPLEVVLVSTGKRTMRLVLIDPNCVSVGSFRAVEGTGSPVGEG